MVAVIGVGHGLLGQTFPQDLLRHIRAVRTAEIDRESGAVLGGIVADLLHRAVHLSLDIVFDGVAVLQRSSVQRGVLMEGVEGLLADGGGGIRVHSAAEQIGHIVIAGVEIEAQFGDGVVLVPHGGDDLVLFKDAGVPHQEGDDQHCDDDAHHRIEDGLAAGLLRLLHFTALLVAGAVGSGDLALFLFSGSAHFNIQSSH